MDGTRLHAADVLFARVFKLYVAVLFAAAVVENLEADIDGSDVSRIAGERIVNTDVAKEHFGIGI
jgi:hypothetical protein